MFPTSDKQLDNKMNETAISTTTPSMSLKRKQSIDNNVENENYLPKKKRESAIRSENNLKMLIQNGLVDTSKQKDSPKKVLSLGKEARTETASLISAGKFDKLDALYIKTVEASSNGSKEDVDTSDSEPETLLLRQPKNKLESETLNESKSKNTSTTNDPNPRNTTDIQNATNTSNLPNPTTITKVPDLTNTFNVSNSTNSTKEPNSTSTIKLSNENNTPNISVSTINTKVLKTDISKVSDKINSTNASNIKINKKVPTTNKETLSLLVNNETSKACEPVDSSIAKVSSTNNLDQNEEEGTDSDQSRSSLDAEIKTLHNLILTLAPDTDDDGTENHKTGDIKYIEDIYQTVLSVKSKLDSVYKQRSIELRKSFESIQLVVPELKRGLTLPTLQELKENSLLTGEEPNLLATLDQQPSQTENPSPHQTNLAESPSPLEPSTNLPKCI